MSGSSFEGPGNAICMGFEDFLRIKFLRALYVNYTNRCPKALLRVFAATVLDCMALGVHLNPKPFASLKAYTAVGFRAHGHQARVSVRSGPKGPRYLQ